MNDLISWDKLNELLTLSRTEVTMTALESDIEKDCKDWSRSQGWLTMKYTGERGYPDRVFIREGVTVWVELKRVGKVPTKFQYHQIKQLLNNGAHAYWTDSLEGLQDILGHHTN